LLIIFPIAFLSYLIIEKPWMKLGDQWRVIIEKNHKERLKQLEAQVAHQQEAERRTAVPQEAVTK
jgi:peptidoglycan/LPS O-acetylase OafA/YrhL